jgi:peptidoglycan/LPS O-acetylase OafA/YrhL
MINKQINGYRAVLCLLVVLFHFCVRFFQIYYSTNYAESVWFPDITIVVMTFFVISGFFLSYHGFKKFCLEKIVRLYLPYAITLLIIFPITYFTNAPTKVTGLDLLYNLLVAPLASRNVSYVNGSDWYVFQLIQFFAFWIVFNVIAKAAKKPNLLFIFMSIFSVLCLSSIVLGENQTNVFLKVYVYLFRGRMIFICLGYFFRLFFNTFPTKETTKADFAKSTVLLCFSFAVSELYLAMRSTYWANALYFLPFIGIFVLTVYKQLRFFEWAPFQIVGSSSLFIYLIHETAGYVLLNAIYVSSGQYWLALLVTTITAFAVGMALTYGYNSAQLRIKNALFKKKEQDSNNVSKN